MQGIGGRMSGLVKTSPIPGVIAKIEEHDGIVLDPVTARIDQVAGTVLAYAEGFHNVAVTIALPADATKIRTLCPDALIIAVHTTGLTREEVEELSGSADLITACASRWVREVAGRKALLQAGTAIPVFAMTKRGKAIILDKLKETNEPVFIKGSKSSFCRRFPADSPRLTTPMPVPVRSKIGRFLFLPVNLFDTFMKRP